MVLPIDATANKNAVINVLGLDMTNQRDADRWKNLMVIITKMSRTLS
jgi:hypothetical protein